MAEEWNDVQLLLKEEGYEDAKQYFVSVVRKKKSQGMERLPKSLSTMENTVSWRTKMTGVLNVVTKVTCT